VLRLARATRRDGLDVDWVGADPDPRAHEAASRHEADGIRCDETDAATLLAAGDRFDAVVSNHVLHHLGEDLHSFVAESRALSDGIVLHADIARNRIAYGLYAVGITPLAPGTFLRTDGLRSIRRSFTVAELQAALDASADAADAGAWTVTAPAPFRVLARSLGHA
jgi:2-polyprenyl-3-methyl-5-hydroxy-6-metoxy-1,4-benzoquinol methylase